MSCVFIWSRISSSALLKEPLCTEMFPSIGDDLFKLMMMSSLFSGGGLFGGTGGLFGGGGGGGLGTGTGTMQNNIGLTGFEADPTAGRGSGSSTGSSPGGGLFGGLMGLLSRGAGGSGIILKCSGRLLEIVFTI